MIKGLRNIEIDSLFDTETLFTSYLLGVVASDGYVSDKDIRIWVNPQDSAWIDDLAKYTQCSPHYRNNGNSYGFDIYSTTAARKVSELLQLDSSVIKSFHVNVPSFTKETHFYAFLRGVIDGDGWINNPLTSDELNIRPCVTITSGCISFLEQLQKQIKFNGYIRTQPTGVSQLTYKGVNAQELLHATYADTTIPYLHRKKKLVDLWNIWVPALSGMNFSVTHIESFWKKLKKDAVLPSKNHFTDTGYDLTAIDIIKQVGNFYLLGTGLSVRMEHNWYLDIVARSSLAETGYIIPNAVGVIDRSYVGEIKIPIYKLDSSARDLQLPWKIAQAIPRPIIHMDIIETIEEELTMRGNNGFGSTQ